MDFYRLIIKLIISIDAHQEKKINRRKFGTTMQKWNARISYVSNNMITTAAQNSFNIKKTPERLHKQPIRARYSTADPVMECYVVLQYVEILPYSIGKITDTSTTNHKIISHVLFSARTHLRIVSSFFIYRLEPSLAIKISLMSWFSCSSVLLSNFSKLDDEMAGNDASWSLNYCSN